MRRFLNLVLLGLLLVGCDQAAPAPPATRQPQIPTSQAQDATSTGAYPVPATAYPVPFDQQSATAYPGPTEPPPTALPQGPRFTIDTPVRAADTQVTGTGELPGVPIKLVNLARSNELLGETTVGADRTYTIDLSTKLIAGDRIGLQLGDIAGTQFEPGEFVRGPGYDDRPLTGVVFTSTLVLE